MVTFAHPAPPDGAASTEPAAPLEATLESVSLEAVSAGEPSAAADGDADAPHLPRTAEERIEAARERYFRPRMSLRELSVHSIELDMLLDAAGGELVPELEARMDEMLQLFADNADYIGDHKQAFEIEIAALKNEINRVTERKRMLEKRYERWKARVVDFLRACDRTKLQGEYWTVSVRNNTPQPKVSDDAELSAKLGAEFREEKEVTVTEITVHRDKIKAVLLAWEAEVKAWEKACSKIPEGGELPPAPERPFPDDVAWLERTYTLQAK
jgi:hypothetical protein